MVVITDFATGIKSLYEPFDVRVYHRRVPRLDGRYQLHDMFDLWGLFMLSDQAEGTKTRRS